MCDFAKLIFRTMGLLLFMPTHIQCQTIDPQSFTLAAGTYNSILVDEIQLDWRLDLGFTGIEFKQSKDYFFTAGYLQPSINRFQNFTDWKNADPSIKLYYNYPSANVTLVATAPDLIIYGFKIFTSSGILIKSDLTKIASSFLSKPIDISSHPKGIYYVLVYYLPEILGRDKINNYWTTTLKLIKQ
jgi:hypothetical protein